MLNSRSRSPQGPTGNVVRLLRPCFGLGLCCRIYCSGGRSFNFSHLASTHEGKCRARSATPAKAGPRQSDQLETRNSHLWESLAFQQVRNLRQVFGNRTTDGKKKKKLFSPRAYVKAKTCEDLFFCTKSKGEKNRTAQRKKEEATTHATTIV